MQRVWVGSTIGILLVICVIILFFSTENCDSCFSTLTMMIKLLICGMVLFVGSIYFTRLFLENEKEIFTIETLPLLDTDEATDQVPFSCEASIESKNGNLLYSSYTNTACVYYHSIKEKRVKSGKHYHWRIVENLVKFIPFYLQDKRGKLTVDLTNIDDDFSGYDIDLINKKVPDPDKSEIDAMAVIKQQRYYENSKALGFIPLSIKMRRSEYVLKPSMRVFAYGFVSRKNGELVLHEHQDHPLIISKKTKDQYVNEFYKGRNLVYLVHFLMSIGFSLGIISSNYFLPFGPFLFFPVLYGGNAIILGSIFFTMYNRIVTLRERAKTALSNIDIELKRRKYLIPELETLVKQYASHEKNLFSTITDLRVHLMSENSNTQTGLPDFSKILAVVENYPALKASENYQGLMKSLIDAEERIAYSRTFYNRNVRKLNTLVSQFPFIIISYLFGIGHMKFLRMDFSQ